MPEAEGLRLLDPARERRLVDLDHRAAGVRQAPDLDVERVGERRAARPRIAVEVATRPTASDDPGPAALGPQSTPRSWRRARWRSAARCRPQERPHVRLFLPERRASDVGRDRNPI
jgi:hypothetical protein